ncbi:hypothetical protein Sjap_006005 [Stephania japonica]|uniref:Pentatricopeptide repeat-containing protein n=1 Tax=Stephania japonica TaxID=461633 RepID=A0AAP0K7J2_9MAGN
MRASVLESLLRQCRANQSMATIKSLHALTITMGSLHLDQQIFLNNNLIAAYSSLSDLETAHQVFDKMPERNYVSYNSIISACTKRENGAGAWMLFKQMIGSGFRPTQFTFGSLLSSPVLGTFEGVQLHSLIVKFGLLYRDAFAGTALLGLFGRFGMLDGVMRLFDEMPHRNLVTWNLIIDCFSRRGFVGESVSLFCELMRTDYRPSEGSFIGILSGVDDEVLYGLCLVEEIHGMVIKTGFEFCLPVSNCLVKMYVNCSGTCRAEEMVEKIDVRDIVTWNTIIGALAKSENPMKALEMFLITPWHGFTPTQASYVIVISSCASLQVLVFGELIHAKIIKNGFQSDVLVGGTLVDFYAKSNNIELAQLLFDELDEKAVGSWNALIAGYANNNSQIGVHLLKEMLLAGYRANEFTFSAVFKSCSGQELRQLHSSILKLGYNNDEYVCSSLIASYAANGLISEALAFASSFSPRPLPYVTSNIVAGIYKRSDQCQLAENLLCQLDQQGIVSLNTLISACFYRGDYTRAFQLFRDMLKDQILPDKYTVTTLLNITIMLCSLALGSSLHGLIIKSGSDCFDTHVYNLLIDMYAKCGSLSSSVGIFNEMTQRNLISWTVLVSALGFHGYAQQALEKFREMEFMGFKPDRVAFVAVLSACRHGGLAKEGMELFGEMKECYGVEPDMDHYVCMVDLLVKCGHLKEAELLICGMPFQPNAVIWRMYLEGCKMLDNAGKQVIGWEAKVDPTLCFMQKYPIAQ